MRHILTRLFLVLFAVFIATQIYATSFEVSGKVTEKNTGKALEGVNVMIEGSAIGTVTNRNGYFYINVTDGDILVFSYIGFKKHKVKITETRYLNIKLEVKVSNLNAITVSGIRSRNSAVKVDIPIKEIPLTVNIVTSKTLEERNVTNMVDAVKNVNGVRAINRYGGFQTFRFRGFNNFVMLIDGVRDERHNHSTSAPQTNLANVETIEVVKGPESVLYGHSALGGIINVIRKRPTIDEKYNVSVSYGSFNSKTFNAGIGGSISEKLRYRTDFGLTETDGWRGFGQKTANGYVALNWDIAKDQNIEIQVGANRDKYDTDTGIPVLSNGSLPEKVDISTRYNDPADFLKHKRYDFQLNYENRISDDMIIRNKASYYFDDINYLSTESLSYNAAKDSLKRTYPFYFNHMAYPFQNQLEMVHNFNIGKMKNKFLAGYSLGILHRKTYYGDVYGPGKNTTISVVNPELNQGNINYRETHYLGKDEAYHGFFIQDWLEINSKLKLLLGMRFDIFRGTYYTDKVDDNRTIIKKGEKRDINKNSFTYRAGLVYKFSQNFSGYGSFSTYFKPSRRITEDGKVFDPENGYQGEAGLRYSVNNIININLAGFYIKKKNIVEYLGRNSAGKKIYAQVGGAESKGVELDIQLNLNNRFNLNAGYSYCKAKFLEFEDTKHNKNAGNSLRYVPENMLKIWGTYKIAKNIGIGFGLNYIDENYTNTSNTYKLPSYTVVDASLYYSFGSKEIRLNVNNLFNKEYFTDAIMSNQFFPGAERNFNIMFRFYN